MGVGRGWQGLSPPPFPLCCGSRRRGPPRVSIPGQIFITLSWTLLRSLLMVPDLTKKERKPMGINLRLTDLYKGAGWRSDLQRAPE